MATGKGSYGSAIKKLDKGAFFKKAMIFAAIFMIISIGISIAFSLSKQKEEQIKEQLAQAPTAVPTSIKYYNPQEEESYETGTDYIILADGDQRIKVDARGQASYLDSNGTVTGYLTEDELATYKDTIFTIMDSDYQAKMALSGIEDKLPSEQEDEKPKEPTKMELLNSRLESMGITFPDFMDAVSANGSTVENAIALMDMMKGKEDSVIRSIMTAAENKEKETKAQEENEKKMIGVEVSTIGGTGSTVSPVGASTSSDTIEYPSWLEMPDYSSNLTAAMETLATAAAGTPTQTAYEQQNRQAEKKDWVKNQQEAEVVTGKISKYDLVAGTVVPITLVTGLNTDLPGEVIGLVRQDVYDTLTGTEVLIPKGSRLMASYNNSVTFGQKSVQIAWNYLITPDGYTFTLPGFQGVTPEGYTGVKATKVKTHFWSILGGAILGSIIDYGAGEISKQATNAVSSLPGAVIIAGSADAAINTTSTIGKKYTDQWMNQQPTLIIKTGAQMQMLVNQTVRLKKENL